MSVAGGVTDAAGVSDVAGECVAVASDVDDGDAVAVASDVDEDDAVAVASGVGQTQKGTASRRRNGFSSARRQAK